MEFDWFKVLKGNATKSQWNAAINAYVVKYQWDKAAGPV